MAIHAEQASCGDRNRPSLARMLVTVGRYFALGATSVGRLEHLL